MDNAVYHSYKSELLCDTAWRKEGLKQWLLAKNAPFPDDYLKRELLQAMLGVRNGCTSCVVYKMAKQGVRPFANFRHFTIN